MESLSEEALVQQALAERQQRAIEEKMHLKSMQPKRLWTDYVITNQASGKSYRIALRGWQPGESYCSCPDFRKNTLGTCKHIIYAQKRGGQMVSAAFAFMGEMFADNDGDDEIGHLAGLFKARLGDCMEKTGEGQLKMTITLPNETFLDNMARSMDSMAHAGRR
jgi:hypothetical protein